VIDHIQPSVAVPSAYYQGVLARRHAGQQAEHAAITTHGELVTDILAVEQHLSVPHRGGIA
jgi:hypothetical protein